jgi:hypothetical protein
LRVSLSVSREASLDFLYCRRRPGAVGDLGFRRGRHRRERDSGGTRSPGSAAFVRSRHRLRRGEGPLRREGTPSHAHFREPAIRPRT